MTGGSPPNAVFPPETPIVSIQEAGAGKKVEPPPASRRATKSFAPYAIGVGIAIAGIAIGAGLAWRSPSPTTATVTPPSASAAPSSLGMNASGTSAANETLPPSTNAGGANANTGAATNAGGAATNASVGGSHSARSDGDTVGERGDFACASGFVGAGDVACGGGRVYRSGRY